MELELTLIRNSRAKIM